MSLQIGIDVAAKQGDLVSHALALAEDGWLRIALGDFGRAHQNLNTALELAKKTGDHYLVGWPLTYQAYLILLAGEQAEWRDGLDKAHRAIVAFRDVNEVRQLTRGLDVSARLHLALGELSEALEISNEVMHLFQTTPALPKPQEHLYTHARVLRALGRDAEADEHLRRAHERVMFVAENTSDEALRQRWLENVRVNQEILREWEEQTSEE